MRPHAVSRRTIPLAASLRRLLSATLAGAVAGAMAIPSIAAAQTCVGSGALAGQFAVGGAVSFTGGAAGLGAGVRANLDGPLSLGLEVGVRGSEGDSGRVTTIGGEGAFEIPTEGVATCAIGGVEYTAWSETFEEVSVDVSALAFPIGMSVGTRLGDPASAEFIPSARAGLFYERLNVSATGVDGQTGGTDAQTEFFVGAGAAVLLGRFFANAGVSKSTIEGTDAVIAVGLGVMF